MPLLPVSLPQQVPIRSGFDCVAVDAQRRRVYAAHTASSALLVVDADSGKVLRQIRVGAVHGIAVDPANGHVYTGNGNSRTVSEADPEAGQVVREVGVSGNVDGVAYDSALHRIYADEADGTRIFVIDAATMKEIGTVALPGRKLEFAAVDPESHDLYQNIADLAEYVVVDSKSLTVKQIVKTPDLTNSRALQYDPVLRRIVVAGGGGLAVYDREGRRRAGGAGAPRSDQCDLDPKTHLLACAGAGFLMLYSVNADTMPTMLAQANVPKGVHTTAIDARTSALWIVWATDSGDFVQAYRRQ